MKQHEIPGRVAIVNGLGGLPKVSLTTRRSTAEVYLNGANVTGFQKNGEPPLIFLSRLSQFENGKSPHCGVPVIYPWFGQREGAGLHGFARTAEWELAGSSATDDRVTVKFNLPESASAKAGWPPAKVSFIVTAGDKLTMELMVTNSTKENLTFESCLHTYFAVGDIGAVSVSGLQGVHYLDKVENFARKLESADAFKITSEVDRVFLNASGTVKIHDINLRRTILVEKSGSNSTVVWNPWIAKAQTLADIRDEYRRMLCVESGNVNENKITLAPGGSSALKVMLGSEPA